MRGGSTRGKGAYANPPLRRRGRQGPKPRILFKARTPPLCIVIESVPTLGFQASISFFSSMAGMAVYMWFYCPNRRCCRTSEVRSLLETKTNVKTCESKKENR